jgi:hypothetical protein
MGFREPPKPTDDRARLTEELIARKETDTNRWANLASLATQWDARAAMAAEWIPGDSRVLDIGAGAMALGGLLARGCVYQPADVVERRPGCLVVDLNRREFPQGRYDWVTFLGVLEYVHDIAWALDRAAEAASRMIVTYCTFTGGEVTIRRGMGWVNDLGADAFRAELSKACWKIDREREVKRGPANIQLMWQCSR